MSDPTEGLSVDHQRLPDTLRAIADRLEAGEARVTTASVEATASNRARLLVVFETREEPTHG